MSGLSPARIALGRAVRVVRVRREIASQEALSRAAGLGKDTAGAIERGAVDPTYSTLRALADALRVELAEMIELAGLIEREIAPVVPERNEGRLGGRPSRSAPRVGGPEGGAEA